MGREIGLDVTRANMDLSTEVNAIFIELAEKVQAAKDTDAACRAVLEAKARVMAICEGLQQASCDMMQSFAGVPIFLSQEDEFKCMC